MPIDEEFCVYTLGDTFTPKEKEALSPYITSVNSAASGVYHRCMEQYEESRLSVAPSRYGDGVFAGKNILNKTLMGMYVGVLHNKEKYDGRRDYVMDLPDFVLPSGQKFTVLMCGYEQRAVAPNASMFNNAKSLAACVQRCRRFSSRTSSLSTQ